MVITGIGAVTPFGLGIQTFWEGLVSGQHCFELLNDLPKPLVGAPAKRFEPGPFIDPKWIRQNDRFVLMAVMAAVEAVDQAESPFSDTSPERIGVVMGNAVGGLGSFRQGTLKLLAEERLSPFFVPSFIPNMAAARIAMYYGLHGPNLTLATACAAGTDAIGVALDLIRSGRADVVLAGGAESLLIPEMVMGLYQTRALSAAVDPDRACRPFDVDRSGMVIGEGAGVLVLEQEEHANRRRAQKLARLIGYGTHSDGEHPAAPAVDGHGERYAMSSCLVDAGLSGGEIDYVNAHGTATSVGDRVEWNAIHATMGKQSSGPLVSSIKGSIGHLLGGAGAIEAVATVLILKNQLIPPTTGCQTVDPECPLEIVSGRARRHSVGVAVSNSFGLGGQNASIALAHPDF